MKQIHLITLIIFTLMGLTAVAQLPITPSRIISFETTEGTRMNVDLSPDGATVIFDLLGDLYTMPVTGGEAKQLTKGLEYDHKAAWSPDGRHIAYLSDKSGSVHCWVIDSDGSNARQLDFDDQLSRFSGPSWVPGTAYIAIPGQKDEYPRYPAYLYHMAGGKIMLPKATDANVQFSADGKFIYCCDNISIGAINGGMVQKGLNCYDRHTGITSQLPSPGKLFGNPLISPDGQWLAYITAVSDSTPACSLRIFNLFTKQDILLADTVDLLRRHNEKYVFTPDSKFLIIGYGGKLHRINIEEARDEIIPFHANINVECGAFNYNTYRVNYDSLSPAYIRWTNISPDGKYLLFSALNKVYKMALPDGKPVALVDNGDAQFQATWSPDGKWIAFVSWNDSLGGHLWYMPSGRGKSIQLTKTPAHYQQFAWMHNSKSIAVVKAASTDNVGNFNGNAVAELIDLESKQTRIIADSIDPRSLLSFSGNDSTLYVSFQSEKELSSIQVNDPKHRKKLMITTHIYDGPSDNPDLAVPSPDGKYIAISCQEDIYITPWPDIDQPIIIADFKSKNNTIPFIRVTRTGGIDPHWEKSGKILSWTFANKYYSINIDSLLTQAVTEADLKLVRNFSALDSIGIPLRVEKFYAKGRIALKGMRILTMKDNKMIEDGVILINGGRIDKVGPSATIEIPAGVKTINLKGKTIMPGLIDMHGHLDGYPVYRAIQQPKLLTYLAFGVTTTRDPSSCFESFGNQELLQTGKMIGPRLFTTGLSVFGMDIKLNSLQDARDVVAKRKAYGTVIIKEYHQDNRQKRQWLLMASKEAGLNMTNEGDEFNRELCMAIDGSTGIEHQYNFYGGIYSDVKQFLAASRTWLTPTLQQNFLMDIAKIKTIENLFYNRYHTMENPKLNHFMSHDYIKSQINPENFISSHPLLLNKSSIMASLRNAGAHVTMGSHGDCVGIGAHYETWALKMGGLSNMQALQSATILAAEGLGMQQDLGSIEEGKIADLLILDENPLDNIENTLSIKYVMKDGILYNGDTLDQIWPVTKKLPAWRIKR